MKKRVLATFIVILMILHMVPVYAVALEGSPSIGGVPNFDDAPLIETNSTIISLTTEGSCFKFIPTQSTTYTISTTGASYSDALLYDINGNTVDGAFNNINNQFEIVSNLIAYETYYLEVIDYNMQNDCTLNIIGGGLFAPDTTPPAPPVISSITSDSGASSSDGITSDTSIEINGTAEANSTVSVKIKGFLVGSTTTNESGNWTFDHRSTSLGDGIYLLTAAAMDAAGNTSDYSNPFTVTIDTLSPEAPVITSINDDTGASGFDGVTKDYTIMINGTAEPNSYVELYKESFRIGTTQANASGSWSFDYRSVPLADGTYQITAAAIDAAYNMSDLSTAYTVTIDTTRPAAPSITSISDDTGVDSNDKITNDNTLTISGTAEAGSYVEIFNADTFDSWGTSLSDGNGNWSINPESNYLTNGVKNAVAKARDLASNESEISSVFTFTIDRTVPNISALSPVDNSTSVGINDNLVITFSENIYVGTGYISIYQKSDSSLFERILVTDSKVTGSGTNMITINPSSSLGSRTQYYVQIDATAFTDAAGNRYAGIADLTSWNFTAEIIEHTVTFVDHDGAILKEEIVEEGNAATAPTNLTREGHAFAGWDIDFSNVTDDLTVIAQWDINQYTITFDTDGGSSVSAITQDYGTAISAPADPTKIGYTFASWDTVIPSTMPAQNMTITAQWDINQYTITFDTDGGSSISAITQNYGTAISEPSDPTKVGHTFAGWDTAVPGTMPATNMTITSNWDVNEYTITFDSNGGSSVAAITQDYGTAITAPADPTRTGFTFAGWDTAVPGTMPAGDMTITASWDADEYTITFDSNGGSTVPVITQDYGTTITAPADPTRTGFTFAGWDRTIPGTMPAENMNITASWDVNEYTITFDTNGGSAVSAITQDYGTSIAAPANPTRTGYTFAGWNRTIPGTMPAGNMTITANWDANKYTITFNSNGGSTVSAITQDYGTAISAPAVPTRTGYTFTGWDATIPGTMPAGNMTITASWDANEYTITFDTDGGGSIAAINQNYGTTITEPADPTKEGHTFTGWIPAIPSTMPAQDMTITAQWELTAVQRVINSILGLPDADDVELMDGEEIKLASRLYNDLSESEKQEIPSDLVSSLSLVGTTFAELNMVDNTSGLSIKVSDGTVLDPNLELVVEKVDEASDHNLIIEQTFGNKKLLQVFDISLMLDGQTVQPSGTIRVSIPIPTELLDGFENHQIVFISEDGTATVIPSTVEGNMIWFETDHFSDYGIIADAMSSENDTDTDTDKENIPKTGETTMPLGLGFFIFSTGFILLKIRRKIVKGQS